MQSTDVSFQEETALFQNSRGDVSGSFEFRLPWDDTLNILSAIYYLSWMKLRYLLNFFCTHRVQMVEKSPFKYCFNL